MVTEFAIATRFAVGIVFLWSGARKAIGARDFFDGLGDYGVEHPTLAATLGTLVIVSEITVALSHLSGWLIQWALLGGAALLTVFAVLTVTMLIRGTVARCLCFGASDDEPISRKTVLRLVLMLAAEVFLGSLWMAGTAAQTFLWPTGTELTAVVLCGLLLLLVGGWVVLIPEVASNVRSWLRDMRPAA